MTGFSQPGRRVDIFICTLLCLATVAVYWQTTGHDFILLDDPLYVTDNPQVRAGLTFDSICWAFTADNQTGNWHPLTWLSHLVDYQLFGPRPGWHHLVNVLFHLANTILLFLLLREMTGARWCSAFTAALFALHPLHVESVAWISERKDVLYTLFWLLAMRAYTRYARQPRPESYLHLLILFAVGLMAKPMMVTLPCVLLLLDYWPLGRLELPREKAGFTGWVRVVGPRAWRLIREKIPLFVLAAGSSLVTVIVQRQGGAAAPLDLIPMKLRLANALTAYVNYVGQMLWPRELTVFYPLVAGREAPFTPQVWIAGAVLLLLTALFLVRGRRSPHGLVGWLWFIGTLVPVIGLVHVGSQSMADRYTYVPLIGLFIGITWGASRLTAGLRHRRILLVAAAMIVLPVLTVCSWIQVGYWKDTISLFSRTLEVTERNSMAHLMLGVEHLNRGNLDEAELQFLELARLKPSLSLARHNLGAVYANRGDLDQAADCFRQALEMEPGSVDGHFELGTVLARQQKYAEAIDHFESALKIDHGHAGARDSLQRTRALLPE